MLNHDLIRVHHMLDAATEALAFASDRTRAHLEDDRMLVLSLLKSIEIVGEAAAREGCPRHSRQSTSRNPVGGYRGHA